MQTSASEQAKVLCVDDERRVLEGLELQLGWDYEVHLADSGPRGLEILEGQGPFSVVISDMRMPRMNGATFLKHVHERDRDATRVLLTGYADVEAAVSAVNEGHIFRFLQKPCQREDLLSAVSSAAEHSRLVRAERSLLEDTLNGAVETLTELLSLTAPLAFSRAKHVKAYVRHVARQLQLEDPWQYEVAALLSQLGCIMVPPETLQRLYGGQSLSCDEEQMIASHPTIGHDLVANIPRLELAARMIAAQTDDIASPTVAPVTDVEKAELGGAILRIAAEIDARVHTGESIASVLADMRRRTGYPGQVFDALEDFQAQRGEYVVRAVSATQLQPFMVLDEDVRSLGGSIVVPAGRELDRPLLERLKNFAGGVGLVEPIRVKVPADTNDRVNVA